MDKLRKLQQILTQMHSVLIAYSAGVDSTFLLKVAAMTLPRDRLLAVTANSPTYPKLELLKARRMTKKMDVRHKIIKTQELKDRRFVSNPANRCYFCKKELFSKLKSLAREFHLRYVVDASSSSDRLDFRPGERAKKEFCIRSPLAEACLNKEEIRCLSKTLGLPTWNQPAQTCLASRIPYGERILPIVLARVDKAESYLRRLGFRQVRLRHYNGLCRIEVGRDEIQGLFSKRETIVKKFKKLGYYYVTLDLEGYRTGSMNEILRRP
ncbi:MAG: adenine nucleotide alpha hydrolase [Omnitrophica WOR_2 bacterium SM23_72]|nr:MAG: adenine nucleotide alpha hydrolase [Omnitrophica WOR_2 bacterium SM23_72]